MNRNILYSLLIIIISSLYNNCLEILIEKGYPAELILTFRSILVVAITVIIASFNKLPFLPNNIALQTVRLLNTGIALFLLLESYKTLSASTVSLLSRLDIPLVIFFSIAIGQRKAVHQIIFSILVMGVIVYLAFNAGVVQEETEGFLYGISSVLLLSISYLILKKSVEVENPFMLAKVASIGGILVGSTLMIIKKTPLKINLIDSWLFITVAFLTILIFYFGSKLYKMYSVEKARIAYVFIPIVTMIVEMINEKKWFGLSQISFTIILTGLILLICYEKLLTSKPNTPSQAHLQGTKPYTQKPTL